MDQQPAPEGQTYWQQQSSQPPQVVYVPAPAPARHGAPAGLVALVLLVTLVNLVLLVMVVHTLSNLPSSGGGLFG